MNCFKNLKSNKGNIAVSKLVMVLASFVVGATTFTAVTDDSVKNDVKHYMDGSVMGWFVVEERADNADEVVIDDEIIIEDDMVPGAALPETMNTWAKFETAMQTLESSYTNSDLFQKYVDNKDGVRNYGAALQINNINMNQLNSNKKYVNDARAALKAAYDVLDERYKAVLDNSSWVIAPSIYNGKARLRFYFTDRVYEVSEGTVSGVMLYKYDAQVGDEWFGQFQYGNKGTKVVNGQLGIDSSEFGYDGVRSGWGTGREFLPDWAQKAFA